MNCYWLLYRQQTVTVTPLLPIPVNVGEVGVQVVDVWEVGRVGVEEDLLGDAEVSGAARVVT